jgi:TPR repeat protein
VKDDNYAEAQTYYRKAAQAGNADAMFALGRACFKQYNQHLGGHQASSPSTAEEVVAQIRQARKENLRKKRKRERGEHVPDEHAAKFEHLVEALDWLQAGAKAK